MDRTAPGVRGWVRLAAALLVLGSVGALLATEAAGAWRRLGADPGWGADDVVAAVAATAGAATALLLLVTAGAAGAALRSGGPGRPRLVPALVHRSTAVLLGVTIAAGAPAPAPAVEALDPGWRTTTSAAAAAPVRTGATATSSTPGHDLDPGWRPAAAPAPPARTVAQPIDPVLLTGDRQPPDERALVTVRRGDTLWDLAARVLGPTASDAEIAAQWPRWYAANRDVVGTDPDLLLPGQQLVPPAGGAGGPDG